MSLASLMQAAIAPTSSPSAPPSPSAGYAPPSVSDILAALSASGTSGSGNKSVPTKSTRARNASPLGAPSVNNPLVFWGDITTPAHETSPDDGLQGKGNRTNVPASKTPHELTMEQADNQIYQWDPAKLQEMSDKLKAAGYNVSSFADLANAWGSVVQRAAMMYSVSNGNNKVTPDDVIAMSISGPGSFGSGSVKTASSVTRTVNDLTEGQAWNVLQNSLQQELGRNPTDRETRDFAYRMNILAAKNPTIDRSTSSVDTSTGQQVGSATHTITGGFTADDAAQAAQAQAQANPDYGAYQAGTTYFNAALSALGAL